MLTRLISQLRNQHNISRTILNRYNKLHTNVNKTLFQKTKVSNTKDKQKLNIKSTLYYITAAGVLTVGLSYAAVPLYRMFCQAYSYGGTTSVGHDASKIEHMKANKNRELTIRFNADTAASMRWNFKPQQSEIKVIFRVIFCKHAILF